MILSLTYFDPSATGAVTLPLAPNDMPAQPEAEGDMLRVDPNQHDSFDVVFSLSGAPAKALPAHPWPHPSQTIEAGQQDKSEDDALDVPNTELMETPDNQLMPEMIDPEAPQITIQRSEGAKGEGHAGEAPDNPKLAASGKIETPEVGRVLAVMPDDVLPHMPRPTVAEQADTPKPQVEMSTQASRVTAFDLAARSAPSVPSAAANPPSMVQGQTADSVTDSAQNGIPVQRVRDPVRPAEMMRGAAPDVLGMAEIKARAPVRAALSGQVWGASENASEPGFSMVDRGVITPAATESGRPTPLAGLSAARQALPELEMRPRHDGVLRDFAKRDEILAAGTPAVVDGLTSKPVQAASPPASPLPAVSKGAVLMEEVRLSRVGFQPDIGAVTDQRALTEIVHTGRSDAPARSDLPRHVAAQLAEAVHRSGSGDRPIEVTLNPAELGRVRISMAPGDSTIIVTVLAERGETLDLMRRHADQLAQDFHDLGYGSTEFAFGQNSDGQGGAQDGAASGAVVPSDTISSSDGSPRPIHLNADRVDIRL